MPDLKKMRDERGKLVKQAREIVNAAEERGSALTTEERGQYDDLMNKVDELRTGIDDEIKLQDEERATAEIVSNAEKIQRDGLNQESPEEVRAAKASEQFRSYLMSGSVPAGAAELRGLQADADVDGGYLVPTEQFVNMLIKGVDDMTFIRNLATIFPVTEGGSLGVPSLDTDPSDADWTGEVVSVSEDTSMKLGKRSLTPHNLTKLVKISIKLLRNSAIPADQLVADRLAYKFGITEEKGFLTGNGSQQPLGLFTASADGISTSRDKSTGNTTTEIRFDGLKENQYNLKAQYQANAQWLFHRDGVKQVAKIKDGNGQYIWEPSTQIGEPDLLLGRPVNMSEYAPNTFTTGLYVGLFGDFSWYWIADSMKFELQRLSELYAANSQVGFIGRQAVDGMPVLEAAFSRIKLA